MDDLSTDSLAGSPASAAHSGGSGGSARRCQVPGCQADLVAGFYWKYRVCQPHSSAPVLVLEGVHKRFCQQCSKFHALEAFDGERRSCRASLERHQQRRQRRRLQRAEEERAQPLQPKRKREAAAKGQAEEEGGEEQVPQRRRRQPASSKRQGSSQGSRQTAQPAWGERPNKKPQPLKRTTARPKAQPAAAPKVQPQPGQRVITPVPVRLALPQQLAPVQPVQRPQVAAQQVQQAQQLQLAGQLAATSPLGPMSPPSQPSRPPQHCDPVPQPAAASGGQLAAAAAPASRRAAWHAPTSQVDWEALLAPSAALLPGPPLGAADELYGGSSHASWPALSAVGAAELEELCQIETPLFPEWERPQPEAGTAMACSVQLQTGGAPLPPLAPSRHSRSLPSLPVPWQGSMQPCVLTRPVVPAAKPPAALSSAGLAELAAMPLPALPGAPPPAVVQQLPQQQRQAAWQQGAGAPPACELPLHQQGWQAAWVEQQLSASASAACSAANAAAFAPHALPATTGGIPASIPACTECQPAWQPSPLQLPW